MMNWPKLKTAMAMMADRDNSARELTTQLGVSCDLRLRIGLAWQGCSDRGCCGTHGTVEEAATAQSRFVFIHRPISVFAPGGEVPPMIEGEGGEASRPAARHRLEAVRLHIVEPALGRLGIDRAIDCADAWIRTHLP